MRTASAGWSGDSASALASVLASSDSMNSTNAPERSLSSNTQNLQPAPTKYVRLVFTFCRNFLRSASGTIERRRVSALATLESGVLIGLERFLHVRKVLVGHRAVDDAVIERDREIRARADGDHVLAIGAGHHFGSFFDRTDTQDCDLGLVDDRRSHERAEHARIGDRERAALHFFGAQLLGARAAGEVVERARDARE